MNQQYCTFRLDSLTCGIEVERVQEVLRYQRPTRVPLANPVVRGLINLRGRIVPALDLRTRMGLPLLPPEQEPMNLVVRTPDGILSLLVDEIGGVIDLGDDTFELPPATLPRSARALIRGAHKLHSQLLLVLDTDEVLQFAAC